MLAWLITGFCSGGILSLASVGAGIVAIPLFGLLAGATHAEATLYSLIAIAGGASVASIAQREFVDWRGAAQIAVFAWVGAALATPLKLDAPPALLVGIFVVVSILSLISLWRNDAFIRSQTRQMARPRSSGPRSEWWPSLGGLIIGVLITLSGVGGGIFLVPFLVTVLRVPLNTAMATSLLANAFAAAGSIAIQAHAKTPLPPPANVLAMLAGAWVAALLVNRMLKRLPSARVQTLRLSAFTLIVGFAITYALTRGLSGP